MSADEHLSPSQFTISATVTPKGFHVLQAKDDDGFVGQLAMHSKGTLHSVHVHESQQRKGVATALWRSAQQRASSGEGPAPKHSKIRSEAGDAWARSVGGRMPPLAGGQHTTMH